MWVAIGFLLVVIAGSAYVLLTADVTKESDAQGSEDSEDGKLRPGQVASQGDPLPDMELDRHDGGVLQLGESDGRPMVINFFASWCAPCVAEMPRFEEVHEDLGDEVRFLGVASTDERPSELELIESTGVTYETVRDPLGDVMAALGVLGLPATIFVDGDGRIADYHIGELDGDELRTLIDEHLRS
jgi:thiol-disulfide isomerase/thioredoxin